MAALFSARLGRPSVPVDTLLRLLYLKHRYGLGYESSAGKSTTRSRGGGSAASPWTGRAASDHAGQAGRRAGPEVIEQLNPALVAKLAQGKLLRARKLRVDTTVVEADIDYPTDADLLEQAVRKLGGLVRRIKGVVRPPDPVPRSGRAAGRRHQAAGPHAAAAHRGAMAEVDRLTGEVARIARQSLRQVQSGGGQCPPGTAPADPVMGDLVGWSSELEETITATGRLLAQTDQRLAGDRVIPDRLVSLARPGRPPDPQGQAPPPTQFGYSLLLAEDERGFIADHQLQQGNPPDAPQLVPSVSAGGGHRAAAGDGGRRPRLRTAANDRPWPSLGVKRIGLQRTGTPGKARQAWERTRAFRRLRNWRVGIEARISHLKRSFGLRRTRLRRLGGARTWVGLGIFAYNLQRMTVVAG